MIFMHDQAYKPEAVFKLAMRLRRQRKIEPVWFDHGQWRCGLDYDLPSFVGNSRQFVRYLSARSGHEPLSKARSSRPHDMESWKQRRSAYLSRRRWAA